MGLKIMIELTDAQRIDGVEIGVEIGRYFYLTFKA